MGTQDPCLSAHRPQAGARTSPCFSGARTSPPFSLPEAASWETVRQWGGSAGGGAVWQAADCSGRRQEAEARLRLQGVRPRACQGARHGRVASYMHAQYL